MHRFSLSRMYPRYLGFIFMVAVSLWLSEVRPFLSPLAATALEWQPGPGYRGAVASVPASGKTGFTLLPPGQTGITFTNFISEEKGLENSMRLSGSGVAAGDVNNLNGLAGIYPTNPGSRRHPGQPSPAAQCWRLVRASYPEPPSWPDRIAERQNHGAKEIEVDTEGRVLR